MPTAAKASLVLSDFILHSPLQSPLPPSYAPCGTAQGRIGHVVFTIMLIRISMLMGFPRWRYFVYVATQYELFGAAQNYCLVTTDCAVRRSRSRLCASLAGPRR